MEERASAMMSGDAKLYLNQEHARPHVAGTALHVFVLLLTMLFGSKVDASSLNERYSFADLPLGVVRLIPANCKSHASFKSVADSLMLAAKPAFSHVSDDEVMASYRRKLGEEGIYTYEYGGPSSFKFAEEMEVSLCFLVDLDAGTYALGQISIRIVDSASMQRLGMASSVAIETIVEGLCKKYGLPRSTEEKGRDGLLVWWPAAMDGSDLHFRRWPGSQNCVYYRSAAYAEHEAQEEARREAVRKAQEKEAMNDF